MDENHSKWNYANPLVEEVGSTLINFFCSAIMRAKIEREIHEDQEAEQF